MTKFLGPTNFRGARVKASAQAGSVTIGWDHALDTNENHDAAAKALATRWGWLARGVRLVGGAMPDGSGNAYVLTEGKKR